MINEIRGFSIIINSHIGYRQLPYAYDSFIKNSDSNLEHEIIVMLDDPSWKVLKVCQDKNIPYHIVNNRCPYKTWHDGVKLAKNDWFCFFPEDVYAIKGWDVGLCKWHQGAFNKGVWVPIMIEAINADRKTAIHFKEAGEFLENLDEEKLYLFAKSRYQEKEIVNNFELGWTGPYLIHRYWYFQELGGYPNCETISFRIKREFYKPELKRCKGGCGFDNNFRDIIRQKGINFHLCLNSFLFHEQGYKSI